MSPPPPPAHARRVSGFHCPTNGFQVLSWALYLGFVAAFYALLFLFPPTAAAQALWGAFFGAAALATGAAAAAATAADPADPAVYRRDAASTDRAHVAPGTLYCYYCARNVDESSKHCIECWKCVHRFDHHCVWLNSCVGSANYAAFVALLAAAAAMLAIEAALCIYLVAEFGMDQAAFAARVADFYPSLSGAAFFGITVGLLVAVVAGAGLVLQLLFFHIYLIRHGLTTYDFIMGKTSPSAPAASAAPEVAAAAAAAAADKPPTPALSSRRASAVDDAAAAAAAGGAAADYESKDPAGGAGSHGSRHSAATLSAAGASRGRMPLPAPHVSLLAAYRAPAASALLGMRWGSSADDAVQHEDIEMVAAADADAAVPAAIAVAAAGAAAAPPPAGAADDDADAAAEARNVRAVALPQP